MIDLLEGAINRIIFNEFCKFQQKGKWDVDYSFSILLCL